MLNEAHRPVIVLGAARSGTRMIRAAIAAHPRMVAIPHDINFIWKYGLYYINHDELTPDDLTPKTAVFIRKFFERFCAGQPEMRVVEKTVSNTIRVDFVRHVFPDCQFVHLIRDGRDVAVSSMRQWQAPLESKKVIDKLKYFPIQALPDYAVDYAWSYLTRKFSRTGQVSTWGVALKDLHALVRRYSLLEVCGIQWSRCVDHSLNALESIPATDKIEVRYEHFVQNPLEEIERIIKFLDLEMSDTVAYHVETHVKSSYVSKWQHQLQQEALERLMLHISSTMKRLEYLPVDGEGRHEASG